MSTKDCYGYVNSAALSDNMEDLRSSPWIAYGEKKNQTKAGMGSSTFGSTASHETNPSFSAYTTHSSSIKEDILRSFSWSLSLFSLFVQLLGTFVDYDSWMFVHILYDASQLVSLLYY